MELSILGYEFPEGANDWHDLNWLSIHVRVKTLDASWTSDPDPCLLTTEARELAGWLRAAAGPEVAKPLEFLEPDLSFAVARPADDRGVPVAITMRHTLVKQQSLVRGPLGELPLLLYMAAADLVKAASDLEGELLPFPVRKTA